MNFKNEHVDCVVEVSGHFLKISGAVNVPSQFTTMTMMAANPVDRMTSYSGSGLPFPCPDIAFENTPNTLEIDRNGSFSTVFTYPNSYYTNDQMQRVPPSIFFILGRNGADPVIVRFALDDVLPLRTLTHRPGRTGPEFYAKKEDLIAPQTAEGVMRALKACKYKYDIA